MQTFNPGAERLEEYQSDGQDHIIGNIFPLPKEFKDLPESINLLDLAKETYNQNCIPSCTAMGLTHNVLLQNIIDFGTNDIRVDWKDQWANQGKRLSCSNETGDYLEHALKEGYKNGIKGTGPKGGEMLYKFDGYAYQRFQANQYGLDLIRYLLSIDKPLYTAMKGTRVTWNEMKQGEVKVIISPSAATGGHAIIITGIDDKFIYWGNSWTPNQDNISTFKMTHENFFKAIELGMINWRFWITYDKKDYKGEELFKDYVKMPDTEEYKAVKFMRDKGFMNGYNGRLMPNDPITREQFCLVMYRIFNPEDKKDDTSSSSKKQK